MFMDWIFSLPAQHAPITAPDALGFAWHDRRLQALAQTPSPRRGSPRPQIEHGHLRADVAYRTVVGMLERDPAVDSTHPNAASGVAYRKRLQAITGLACFSHKSDPRVIRELITIVEDPNDDPRLAVPAAAALAQMLDATLCTTLLVPKITDARLDARARAAYAAGLWNTPNAQLSTQLVPLLRADHAAHAVRLAAALTIGYAANPANDPALIELLDDDRARPYAALAVLLGGSDAAAEKLLEVLRHDGNCEALLRSTVAGEDYYLDLLLESMFTSGQLYRRMHVAQILKDGAGPASVSLRYVWTQLALRLTGWDGAPGMPKRAIQCELYKGLIGHDAARRQLVASMLVEMGATGLLLAGSETGVTEARVALLRIAH